MVFICTYLLPVLHGHLPMHCFVMCLDGFKQDTCSKIHTLDMYNIYIFYPFFFFSSLPLWLNHDQSRGEEEGQGSSSIEWARARSDLRPGHLSRGGPCYHPPLLFPPPSPVFFWISLFSNHRLKCSYSSSPEWRVRDWWWCSSRVWTSKTTIADSWALIADAGYSMNACRILTNIWS